MEKLKKFVSTVQISFSLFLFLSLICSMNISVADEPIKPEEYSGYSVEELNQKRESLLHELQLINEEYISRITREKEETIEGVSLGKISDIFPDEQLAMFVRDKTGKTSINAIVTQKDLDTITLAEFSNYPFASGYYPENLIGISNLRFLERLSIRGRSKITSLPDEICSLIYLDTLIIDQTSITELPENIGDMVSLESLDAESTKIVELPDSICRLPNLRSMYFADSSLQKLPDEIGNLVSLEYLTVSNCHLSKLPESICYLPNLVSLKVNGNKISVLPSAIGNLGKLKILDISDTNITSLPESLNSLGLEELKMQGLSIK